MNLKGISYSFFLIMACLATAMILAGGDKKRPLEGQDDQIEKRMRPEGQSAKETYNLGFDYYKGRGVLKDYEKAKTYFERSLSQGLNESYQISAQYCLGNIYFSGGNGVSKDYQKAKEYFEKVDFQEIDLAKKASASVFLAKLHYNSEDFGKDFVQDYNKAFIYFQKARDQVVAHNVSVVATIFLGEMYYWGRGVAQDFKKARRYFEEVSQQGVSVGLKAFAQQALCTMRHLGQGFEEKNDAETTCAICYEEAEVDNPLKQFPCKNYHPARAHTPCIARTMERNKKCPMCQSEMGPLVMPEYLIKY